MFVILFLTKPFFPIHRQTLASHWRPFLYIIVCTVQKFFLILIMCYLHTCCLPRKHFFGFIATFVITKNGTSAGINPVATAFLCCNNFSIYIHNQYICLASPYIRNLPARQIKILIGTGYFIDSKVL